VTSKADAGQPSKRIAVCLPSMGGGGAERVALEIIDELLTAGHPVDLVLVQAAGELMPLVPATVRIVDLKARRIRGALMPLARYLRRERPHAMQVSMWPLTTVAIAARLLSRAPTRIVTSDHISFASAGAGLRLAVGLTAGLLYRFADHRIVVSEAALRDLADLTEMEPRQFETVYNPLSVPHAIQPTAEAEAAWGGPGPRILTVGSLKRAKNQALLLRAFARLDRKDARVMILGDGPLRGELQALAAELGIAERLAMPGFAIDPWPYYASADLFVLSSDWEGLPMVLIEALAAGVPIVSTDCPSGPQEMLDGGRFGRLVPTGDAATLAGAMERALQAPGDPEPRIAWAKSFAEGARRRYRLLLAGE
jgi:glycosyltransferase involved in cell wall biosynthesis